MAGPAPCRAAIESPAAACPVWEPPVRSRAGGSSPAPAVTEPRPVAARQWAPVRPAARRSAGRRPEPPDPVRGDWVQPAPRGAGLARSAPERAGAGRPRPMEQPGCRAVQPVRLAAPAKAAARSGREPDVAVRRGRPREYAEPLAERTARSGLELRRQAARGDAAARVRSAWPGRPEAPPAGQKAGAACSGSPRPGARAGRDGPPAADPAPGGYRGVPARLVEDVPARPAAGAADRDGRHRPAGPGRAGAMARRNCPAIERWRGSGCRAGAGS